MSRRVNNPMRVAQNGADFPGCARLRLPFGGNDESRSSFAPNGKRRSHIPDDKAKLAKHVSFRSAFTLIELILALLITATLAGSLYMTMRAAFDAQRSAEDSLEPTRSADLAMEYIRNDFQNALTPHDPNNFTSAYQYLSEDFEGQLGGFTGGDADVTFYSTGSMKDHLSANGETKEIELTTDKPPGASQICLVRKCLRNLVNETLPASDEEILCRGVSTFTVRYFDGSEWDESWDSTQENNELPAAVEVTVTLDRPTPQQPHHYTTYKRVFQLAVSNAEFDSQVNSGLSQ